MARRCLRLLCLLGGQRHCYTQCTTFRGGQRSWVIAPASGTRNPGAEGARKSAGGSVINERRAWAAWPGQKSQLAAQNHSAAVRRALCGPLGRCGMVPEPEYRGLQLPAAALGAAGHAEVREPGRVSQMPPGCKMYLICLPRGDRCHKSSLPSPHQIVEVDGAQRREQNSPSSSSTKFPS